MRAPDLDAAADAIERFLSALRVGDDPELQGTGRRVAEAFATELLAGYGMDPVQILADATVTRSSATVVLRDVRTTAMCPHHLLPAPGAVTLGYVPGDKVVGLGALARLVDCFARRLVLQETLAENIATALVAHLGARSAGAVVLLRPTCVSARGSRQHDAESLTLAFAGSPDDSLRAALLSVPARP